MANKLIRLGTRQIPGFPDYYISASGKIYSTRHHRKVKQLAPHLSTSGQLKVTLLYPNSKKGKEFGVARLVLTVWDRPPKAGELAICRDGNTSNVDLANLTWGNHSDHAVILRSLGKLKGREVIRYRDGECSCRFVSIAGAARFHNTSHRNIWYALQRPESRSACGYRWRYAK